MYGPRIHHRLYCRYHFNTLARSAMHTAIFIEIGLDLSATLALRKINRFHVHHEGAAADLLR